VADISVTAASVMKTSATSVVDSASYAGEALTAGQVVYNLAGVWMKSDSSTAAKAAAAGIAMNSAASGQPVEVSRGKITVGGTVAVGVVYYVSTNGGGIAPVADVTTGMYVTPLGVADTTTTIVIDPKPSGVAKA
jgi:hypothetical protein